MERGYGQSSPAIQAASRPSPALAKSRSKAIRSIGQAAACRALPHALLRDDAIGARHGVESTSREFRQANLRGSNRGNRFADTVQTQAILAFFAMCGKLLILFGERGGTRTLDPMIKSQIKAPRLSL